MTSQGSRLGTQSQLMSYLSDISLRRAITLLVAVLAVLATGTWLTVKVATDHLVDEYVKGTASDWAHFARRQRDRYSRDRCRRAAVRGKPEVLREHA